MFWNNLVSLEKRLNFIHVDISKEIFHIIYAEKTFSDVNESFPFSANIAGCFTRYKMRLLFFIDYTGVWPMYNRDVVTCVFLDFLNVGF